MYDEINPNWSYKETLKHIKALKRQYRSLLTSFSYFDLHLKVLYMQKMRDSIYALKFEEWKRDRIWEFMNNYEHFDILQKLK